MSLHEWVVWLETTAKCIMGTMSIASLIIGIYQKNEIRALKYLIFSLCWLVMLLIALEVIP